MPESTSTHLDSPAPAVSVETLGCKVNLFESEYILHQLKSVNWNHSDAKDADVCIINTCTVTREADRQSRQAIRRAVRQNPQATIVVTGCYAEMQPEKCAEIEGVDLVVPGTEKLRIPELVASGSESLTALTDNGKEQNYQLPDEAVSGFDSRTRAYVQVQQGCDNGCTFCIIHEARGASRSILPTTVTRQVKCYVDQGFREIVICGIDLGAYGLDLSSQSDSDFSLASLVRSLATRYPACRFRLSSIDPAHITDELIEVFRECGNVCSHLHLSLQSMSPLILKRMKRRYSPDDVFRVVDTLRRVRPDLILSADVMTGFPTESDEDFELTRSAMHELQIAYPHVFPYSERDGTPAARIPKQVPVEIRKQRAHLLRQDSEKIRQRVLSQFLGKRVHTLVESAVDFSASLIRSRMANFVPVYFSQDQESGREFESVVIEGYFRDGLMGSLSDSLEPV